MRLGQRYDPDVAMPPLPLGQERTRHSPSNGGRDNQAKKILT